MALGWLGYTAATVGVGVASYETYRAVESANYKRDNPQARNYDRFQWYNPADWFGAHDEPSIFDQAPIDESGKIKKDEHGNIIRTHRRTGIEYTNTDDYYEKFNKEYGYYPTARSYKRGTSRSDSFSSSGSGSGSYGNSNQLTDNEYDNRYVNRATRDQPYVNTGTRGRKTEADILNESMMSLRDRLHKGEIDAYKGKITSMQSQIDKLIETNLSYSKPAVIQTLFQQKQTESYLPTSIRTTRGSTGVL